MARDQTKALAVAVIKGFVRAGFSTQDLVGGQIVHTDLPWQCPPIVCDDMLDGCRFSDFIANTVRVDETTAMRFYKTTLAGLYAAPQSVCSPKGYGGLAMVLPGAPVGERLMRFAVPLDYPKFYEWGGHMFAVEMANLFLGNLPTVEHSITGDDYWVKTVYGEVGIRDGLVIGTSDWTESAAGFVDVLLTTGRGVETTLCHHDLIAKVRSTLHENESLFEEFAGMDWALQALRVLSTDRLCGELLDAIQSMSTDSYDVKRKIHVIDEALELLGIWMANDRVKISALHEMLVPEIYSATSFYTRVFNLKREIPVVLSDASVAKIRANLLKKREELMGDINLRDRPALEIT